ncbi:hypothetical protein [uncultured Kordia sp.]|uniref:hypothetical protein n=1 Tax=uncultured Kordia sp. TaxID=507699 RepID=UPI00262D3A7E|nr:hypothetical protein [uncultured Kordia sp.]
MKRIFLLLVFSFFISEMTAQSITNGFYFTQKKDIGFQTEAFEFYGKNSFHYVSASCSGTTFGKGQYEIADADSLILTFEYYESPKLYEELKVETTISDRLEIDLKVYEDEENPMPGCTIRLEEDNEFLTDFDGKLNTIVQKPTKDVTMKIMLIGMRPIEIKIPKGTTKISGNVSFNYLSSIPENKKMLFKLHQLKKSKIIVQSPTRSKTFLKVNKRKLVQKVKKHMPNFYKVLFSDFFFSL